MSPRKMVTTCLHSGCAALSDKNRTSEYVHRVVRGKHFTFIINKLLDLHYSLLASEALSRSNSVEKAEHFYGALFRKDLDFGLISDQIRYPIVEGANSREITLRVEDRFKSIANQFAAHLLESYHKYLVCDWPSRAAILESALSCFESRFLPYEEILFATLSKSLNYYFNEPIPVFLVMNGTVFGAFTSEPALTVINVCRISTEFFEEIVIHEATHGTESCNAARSESALATLKRELSKHGKDSKFEAAWHYLIFWNSGELVRRYVNPQHLHYGKHVGIYDRRGKSETDLYRVYWNDFLDGKINTQEALAKVAERL
jgi:hypothetical protein